MDDWQDVLSGGEKQVKPFKASYTSSLKPHTLVA